MKTVEINSLVLAYLGDSVYEIYVRDYLIRQGIPTVKKLQEEAVSYVSAKAQASFLNRLLEQNFFTEEELIVIKRARNTKGHVHPKGCDMITYKMATALEALIGYLKIEGQDDRIVKIMEKIWELSYDNLW